MSEKRFGYGETDLFEWVEEDGEMISTKECVNKLNELSEEKEYFEKKKEYFLSKWSIVHAKNIQLRQEIKELKKENEQLKEKNENLQRELDDLNYFANLKISAMRSDCGHDRCYVTSMQKKGD